MSVRVRGLWKSYGSAPVLNGVDLTFEAGRVHALLGPNGAGKSTLLGCLSGATQPDAGIIEVGADTHAGFTPASAFAAGIAIIYQHLQLIGDLSVADNVFLGQELRSRSGQVRRREQEDQARELIAELGLELDMSRPVSTLSVGEQQIVAIARALRHRPSTLILDEPTAALSEAETHALLILVRRLAAERGLTVIYVTHLLREVLEVADVATVVRDGAVQWTKPAEELTMDVLVQAISPASHTGPTRRVTEVGSLLLELDEFQSTRTGPVSLRLHGGEILGVFGLLGSGRTDLLEGLAGVRPSLPGSIRLGGHPVRATSPLRAQRSGVALVPSDRQVQALFGDLPAVDNVLMPNYDRIGRFWRRPPVERRVFARVAEHVGLVPPDPAKVASEFSGGNAQKMVVSRWITGLDDVRLLLLDEPTQGVDVGARQDIYDLLRTYVAEADRAIIFASSDPDEVVALADRVVVLVDGRVRAVVGPEVGEATLLALAHDAAPHPTDAE